MSLRRNWFSIVIILFLVLILPLAIFVGRQRQEIRKKAAVNDVTIRLSAASAPVGTIVSNNGVLIELGSETPIKAATIGFTYDVNKVAVNNLRCVPETSGGKLPDLAAIATSTPGVAKITCSKQGTGSAVGNQPFVVAFFDINILQASATPITFTLTGITKLAAANGTYINVGSLNNASIVVGAFATNTPVPTPTQNPGRPGTFTLQPASNAVGTNPVLVEIKVNSGGINAPMAQAVIIVDQNLSIVDSSSGNAVNAIIPGSVLPNVLINEYNTSTKIITYGGYKSSSALSAPLNGTLASFYVKTSQTSGTATLSFRTGNTTDDSRINNDNANNILGSAPSLLLNLGVTTTPTVTPTATPRGTPTVVISNLRHALNPTPMPSPAVQMPYVVVSFSTNVQTEASFVLTLPNGNKLCPPNAPASLGCYSTVESFRHTTAATSHSFVAGNLISGNYSYTVYAAIPGDAGSVVSQDSADIAFTVAAGVPGDTNGNGCVGQRDLAVVAINFKNFTGNDSCQPNREPTLATADSNGDFNHDGCVNNLDFGVVSSDRFKYPPECNDF